MKKYIIGLIVISTIGLGILYYNILNDPYREQKKILKNDKNVTLSRDIIGSGFMKKEKIIITGDNIQFIDRKKVKIKLFLPIMGSYNPPLNQEYKNIKDNITNYENVYYDSLVYRFMIAYNNKEIYAFCRVIEKNTNFYRKYNDSYDIIKNFKLNDGYIECGYGKNYNYDDDDDYEKYKKSDYINKYGFYENNYNDNIFNLGNIKSSY